MEADEATKDDGFEPDWTNDNVDPGSFHLTAEAAESMNQNASATEEAKQEAAKKEDMRQELMPAFLKTSKGERILTNQEYELVRKLKETEVENVRFRSVAEYTLDANMQAILGEFDYLSVEHLRVTTILLSEQCQPRQALPALTRRHSFSMRSSVHLPLQSLSVRKLLDKRFDKSIKIFCLDSQAARSINLEPNPQQILEEARL